MTKDNPSASIGGKPYYFGSSKFTSIDLRFKRFEQMELSFLYAVVIGLVYPLVPLYLKEEGVGVLLVSVALSGISASSFVSTLLWGE